MLAEGSTVGRPVGKAQRRLTSTSGKPRQNQAAAGATEPQMPGRVRRNILWGRFQRVAAYPAT